MWKLIKSILEKKACMHDWDYKTNVSFLENGITVGYLDVLICRKCGKIKKLRY